MALETVEKLSFFRQSVFWLRKTRTSESSHAETFSLLKYENRGTRPRLLSLNIFEDRGLRAYEFASQILFYARFRAERRGINFRYRRAQETGPSFLVFTSGSFLCYNDKKLKKSLTELFHKCIIIVSCWDTDGRFSRSCWQLAGGRQGGYQVILQASTVIYKRFFVVFTAQ